MLSARCPPEANSLTVGSIICASARSSNVLIFARAFLGVGAAGLLQGALAIISYAVSLEKVPQYQGIVISALGISVCLGPVIGGALTEYASWRTSSEHPLSSPSKMNKF